MFDVGIATVVLIQTDFKDAVAIKLTVKGDL